MGNQKRTKLQQNPLPTVLRQRRYRETLKESGAHRIEFWAKPELFERLWPTIRRFGGTKPQPGHALKEWLESVFTPDS